MTDELPPAAASPRFPAAEVGVSVALCTYNGARFLGPLLRSIADQDVLPDELVVQDDCSDDDSVQIVEKFALDAPFEVRLEVNDQRQGSTANFATALQRCRGRFLALADQDDVWYPAKLRRLVGELQADPTITMVFSDADLIGEDGRLLDRRLWDTRLVGRTLRARPVVPEDLFARRALTTGCTMAVRRRAVAAALPFPAELGEPAAPMRHDRWLSLISAAVGTVRALPEPLLGFRVHPYQETGVLIGPRLVGALGRAGSTVMVGPVDSEVQAHLARAAQLERAADRVDDIGAFEEARTLRGIADHHRLRARHDDGFVDRLRCIASEFRSGTYGHDRFGLTAVAGDVVRAARRNGSTALDS